jgi:hypothetical protein
MITTLNEWSNIMSYKIQITVDDQLNETIKSQAQAIGLSVSSFARLALMRLLPKKKTTLLDQAIHDLNSNNVEKLTLSQFNGQVDNL